MQFCKVRSPQIKKWRKQIHLKTQFYIRKSVWQSILGTLSDLAVMSTSPNRYYDWLSIILTNPVYDCLLKSQKTIESSPVSFCTVGSPPPWPPTPGPTTSLSSPSYSCTQVMRVSYLVAFSWSWLVGSQDLGLGMGRLCSCCKVDIKSLNLLAQCPAIDLLIKIRKNLYTYDMPLPIL